MSTIKDLYGIGEGGQVAPAKLIQWLLNPTFAQGTFDGVTIGGSQPGPATFTGVVVTTGGISVLGGGVAVVGAFTATTLGIGSTISYTDTGILGTFASNTNSYNQVIAQNLNAGATASSSFLVSNNAGTATTNFVEMGINSSGFTGTGAFNQAGYSFLASASTDLAIGTYGANSIHFVVNSGATDAMTINGTTGAVNVPGAFSAGSFSASSFSIASINNTPIGNTTPSTGAFTTLSATTAIAVTSGGTGVTTSTGSGSNVLNTSPTLVTPALGIPTSGVLTNCTGLPLTTGITGTLPIANGGTGVTTSTGSGSNVLSASPTLVTPVLGTPTSGVLTNCTGLPLTTGITGALGVANGGTGANAGPAALTNLGAAASGANADITSLSALTTPVPQIRNIQPITAAIASNAITITPSALSLEFRNTTLTSGAVNFVQGTPTPLVIASTDSFGLVTAAGNQRLAILAINNAGTIELAATALYGGVSLDETGVITTATASTTATGIKAANVRTGVAYRVIGFVDATFTTGTGWGSLALVQGAGGNAATSLGSLGYGQTYQPVTRTSGTTYYNTTGKPIFGIQYNQGNAGNNTTSTISINGGAAIQFIWAGAIATGTGGTGMYIIPPGASYVITDTFVTAKAVYELR